MIPSLEERSFSLRSPSGKRLHPRIAQPIHVEIDGVPYQASDWGMGGLRLESPRLALAVGDVRHARLAFSLRGFTATIEATLKVVWQAGTQCGVRYIDISTEAARVIAELVELHLHGKAPQLGSLAKGVDLPGAAPSEEARSWTDAILDFIHHARTALLLGCAVLILIAAGLYFVASRLTVYSDYAAVSGDAMTLRAPEAGFIRGKSLEVGAAVRAGDPLIQLVPAVSPQLRADIDQKVHVLNVQIAEQEAKLADSQRGFDNFLGNAQVGLQSAVQQRQALEEMVAAHRRNYERMKRLAQDGWLSYMGADQELIALLADQRNLDAARAAEAAAQRAVLDAQAGRFISDGRSTQAAPADIAHALAALKAQRDALLVQTHKLAAPLVISSPCNCSITSVAASLNAYVAAGTEIAELAVADKAAGEVDALVTHNRLVFLSVGDSVKVYLTDRNADVGGSITAINHNPANTGRTGLPDNLRNLGDYGVVTVALDRGISPPRVGVPALLTATASLRELLRNIPGFGWILGA